MAKKITEDQRKIQLNALLKGKTTRQAGQEAGTSHVINEELLTEAYKLKKAIREDFSKDAAERIKELAKSMLSVVERAVYKLDDNTLSQCSGPQLALIAGIATDKMQLLTGGATENVQISAGPKSDDFLKKLQAKSRRIESAKITEAETITDNIITDISKNSLNNE